MTTAGVGRWNRNRAADGYGKTFEEKALLGRFAKAAGTGEMLNIHDLKAAYEKAIGHPTSKSTVYNLLDRHDWRKLMPRPFHPDRDMQAQIDVKKKALQRL